MSFLQYHNTQLRTIISAILEQYARIFAGNEDEFAPLAFAKSSLSGLTLDGDSAIGVKIVGDRLALVNENHLHYSCDDMFAENDMDAVIDVVDTIRMKCLLDHRENRGERFAEALSRVGVQPCLVVFHQSGEQITAEESYLSLLTPTYLAQRVCLQGANPVDTSQPVDFSVYVDGDDTELMSGTIQPLMMAAQKIS